MAVCPSAMRLLAPDFRPSPGRPDPQSPLLVILYPPPPPYYSRRPTRWLKGLDGRKDFGYGVYVHEGKMAEVLGPKWAGKGAAEVSKGMRAGGKGGGGWGR